MDALDSCVTRLHSCHCDIVSLPGYTFLLGRSLSRVGQLDDGKMLNKKDSE